MYIAICVYLACRMSQLPDWWLCVKDSGWATVLGIQLGGLHLSIFYSINSCNTFTIYSTGQLQLPILLGYSVGFTAQSPLKNNFNAVTRIMEDEG